MTTLPFSLWCIVLLSGCIVFYRLGRRQLNSRNALKFPPGPKPLPLFGNIRDFPPDGTVEYQHWLTHKDKYGDISSVTVMGTTLVLIHNKKMAHELLETMASKTSGRPTMVMANKLCGYESIVVCQGYTPRFRRYRKYLHQELGTAVSAARFRDAQEIEVGRQLVRTLNEPARWLGHCKTAAAATVLKMAYGYTIEPHQPDKLVNSIEKMMTEFSRAAVPMAWAVDIIPALQYLPESIPGAGFKKTASQWRKSIMASAYTPYRFVQRQMAALTHQPSYVSKLIEQLKEEGDGSKLRAEDEEAIIWTAATLYGAAADTTTISLTAFTLAMIKFDHVQRKAQEELDRVVGTDRLPTFEDRPNLPYTNALVKEVTRWWPITPMGFAHTATEDIQFAGFHIPKGAYLLPAVWWFLNDPEVYPNPERFDPDRFLPPRSEPDPDSEAFGYGRRRCPGRFFADSGLYLNIAQSLAVFKFTKAVGKDGKEIEVDVKPKPGILAYLGEFGFRIEPRSEGHVELIRQFELRHAFEEGDAELLEGMEGVKV
ncbi:O-methylsterigmatocystin oxidoreductase [Chaetomium sp. MPI-SDFR-AT-0129]|nr:O-methylsterigmatocystin oxidoreductase [Chaetomium sp. MPI-SDFR-AT-0129]